MPRSWRPRRFLLIAALSLVLASSSAAQEQVQQPASDAQWKTRFSSQAQPLLRTFCLDCHSTEKAEGELDLERFGSLEELRKAPAVWTKVIEMLDNGEMPPKDAKPQPTAEEKQSLRKFVDEFLKAEALANAGDPGPVILRRLSNAEYTYVIRDLTGAKLSPAKEFPADGAAGEGFTNAGAALVMSPSLLEKYFDAGKDVASHAVLLPHGFRFSDSANHQDHVIEILEKIRALYRANSDSVGATQVNLQGVIFDTNDGGRLALEKYVAATLAHRDRLAKGGDEIVAVAREAKLNAKYLGILFKTLNEKSPSRLLAPICAKWQTAKPEEAAAITAEIDAWRSSLWKFSSIGHIGKKDGPKAWQEPVSPLSSAADLRLAFPPAPNPQSPAPDTTAFYLSVSDAGDGAEGDSVLVESPRFVAPGKPDLLLRDLRTLCQQRLADRTRLTEQAEAVLNAAAEALEAESFSLEELAKQHGTDLDVLSAWFAYLGVAGGQKRTIENHLTGKLEKSGGYDFVSGWGVPETPSVLANTSDMHVRVPANFPGKSILVHPSPTLNIVTTFQSPMNGVVAISGSVRHAHPECGNGVLWSLEVRQGASRRILSTGVAAGDKLHTLGPIENVRLNKGDFVSLVIGSRDGNHSCDSTLVDLQIAGKDQKWGLIADNNANLLAGNPHADSYGNEGVWHFHTEPVGAATGHVIPDGSLLAEWQSAEGKEARIAVARRIKTLLAEPAPAADSPNGKLYKQLTSLGGPLLSALPASESKATPAAAEAAWGLDPALFGKDSEGKAIDANSLLLAAPAVLEVKVPTDLIAGREFVARVSLSHVASSKGSAQAQATFAKPAAVAVAPGTPQEINRDPSWSTRSRQVTQAAPILVQSGGEAEKEWTKALDGFRSVFPLALCYTKIVPVDEVVTLTLYYREDDQLQRLMLDDAQIAQLNQLWEDLHFVAKDHLTLVDAFQQLMEYATQDADPSVFAPLKGPIEQRAADFRQALLAAEPRQLDQLVEFAARVYRRPLTAEEQASLRTLYQTLRNEELPHDDAVRFLIARLLASPTFLYKLETAPSGEKAAPVSPTELASRLSFFLWSSMPNETLRALSISDGSTSLTNSEVLLTQTRRMLKDEKIRRMASEFACQWLHIYEFDLHDEKSEKHFPEFASLRADMYEEAIAFFTDMIQNDGSVLGVLNADHTFVNERLAKFYGIEPVAVALGSENSWRRVDQAGRYGRGGVLAMAATLSKQSGASRTSPILRGNWISEVILGEKLPRPPKDVPQLPEEESTDGLSVRQLIEKHSSDARCATCHVKIDPFGFSLERYDAIGRFRETDLGARPLDVKTKAPDGTPMEGLSGLRDYLLTQKKDAFLRQFCKKLLGYALGRGVQLSDEPLLDEMMASLKKNEYRFSAAIEPIVLSKQFRQIRGRDAAFASEH